MADLKSLLLQYISDEISIENRLELNQLLLDDKNEQEAKNILQQICAQTPEQSNYKTSDWEPLIRTILGRTVATGSTPVRRMPIWNKTWFRYSASIIILIGIAVLVRLIMINKATPDIVKIEKPDKINDVAPGGAKAVLYLANGSKILLDSAQNGPLAKLGNTIVTKTDSGKLLYAVSGNNTGEPIGINELRTPRGGIYQLTLPDGTMVWLNAESSITYPTRFDKTQRRVKITGEVYFEVAKDAAHPFIVSIPSMEVEVLGTHFNINSYEDDQEKIDRTTLLEGSVKISSNGKSRLIKPGEQASVAKESRLIEVSDKVNLEKIMAWKNGEMVLSGGDVRKLMREVSRWYDVDITYQGAVPDKKFYGSLNRNVPLSSVLNVLKAYGIETKLENKKIIVF